VPSEPIAHLFPGQGSATPEMRAQTLALRPDLLELVGELVGEDPFPRAGESTRFAQPAILCASLARFSALQIPAASVYLGHSLGELGALVAAGVLDEREALELVTARGRAMDQAGGRDRSGMLAVLGGEAEEVRALAAQHELTLANDNAPGQVVLAGPLGALEHALEAVRAHGWRAVRLGVSAAFHSPAMEAARAPFALALERVRPRPPQAPVFSCITAEPSRDPRAELLAGLTSPVRFRESLLALHELGVRHFVEVGPGRVLTGLVRRTLPGARADTLALEGIDG
jgi:[acyl-carrier-protein] S-malonyltransferase